jgi:putative transposase
VLNAVVHAADIPDRDGAPAVLADIPLRFPRVELVWMDQGYRGERLQQWMAAYDIPQEIVQKPRRWVRCPIDQEPPPMPAFTVLPHCWIVERSFAWLGRWRRLSKDYEELPSTGEAMIYAAMLVVCHVLIRG